MLFRSPEKTILPKIEEMQKQLKEIQQTVEQTQVHTLFQSYNASKVKVNVLTKQMKAAAEGRDLENAYAAVVAANGVLKHVKTMIETLSLKTPPTRKSMFEQYSDILVTKYVDVYEYLARMDAIMDDLQMEALAAILAREIAAGQINDKSKKIGRASCRERD